MKSKIIGSLIGTALGDAFGLPYEMGRPIPIEVLKRRSESREFWGYSDDTEMTIGIAESLIENPDLDPEATLRIMSNNYEPARGYGKGMKLVFRHVDLCLPWKEAAYTAWNEGSKGNGSSSRIAPIACVYQGNTNHLMEKAELSSMLSHAHEDAINGAVVQALAISHLLKLSPSEKFDASSFIAEIIDNKYIRHTVYEQKLKLVLSSIDNIDCNDEVISQIGNGVLATESVPIAILAFLRNSSDFKEAVIEAVSFGGDTDTIGAMCGSLSGAYHGIKGVPDIWCQNLEKNGKGFNYIYDLATRLSNVRG